MSEKRTRGQRIIDAQVSVDDVLEYLVTERYMGMEEATRYLGRSRRWIQAHLREIPHYRLGGKIQFRKRELDDLMSLHRVEAGTVRPPSLTRRPAAPQEQTDRTRISRSTFERLKPYLSAEDRDRIERQITESPKFAPSKR